MYLRISHTTTYSYDAPVVYGLPQARLTPKNGPQQSVLDWHIAITGGAQELTFKDQYGNLCTLVQALAGTSLVSLTVSGAVQTHRTDGVNGPEDECVPLWHFQQPTQRTHSGPRLAKLAKMITAPSGDLAQLHTLSARILSDVPYAKAVTDVTTTAEQAMSLGGGVCQDHAHIFIAALRASGVPARYVSGYLMMNDRTDQDATHAWAEAYVAGLGWVGFDASNGISPDERYVRLATGRDSRDAAPVSGLRMGSAQETMHVAIQVQQ